MTIIIADKFEQSGIDGLKALGCTVVYEPTLSGEALTAALTSSSAQVLIVRSTQVTEAMLDAGQLSLIVRAGAGVNTIDVAAASRRGIYVSNCPGKNAVAVAELTFALMLALDRRIPHLPGCVIPGVFGLNEPPAHDCREGADCGFGEGAQLAGAGADGGHDFPRLVWVSG